MIKAIKHLVRLGRAGRTLARYDALATREQLAALPAPARLALKLAKIPLPFSRKPALDANGRGERLSAALISLGPSYIKLGQFLATRPDVIGADTAQDLSILQDKLPPFGTDAARAEILSGLGAPVDQLYSSFGDAVAAASIAQVHKARVGGDGEEGRDVAVKVLRPGIEQRLAQDLESFRFVAQTAETWHAPTRRLRPVDAVETLARSVQLELDLRMEASAISEMAENIASDPGFRVPDVDWHRTSQRVLTLEWVDGTPLGDLEALEAAGHNLPHLGDMVIQNFLRHAMRDGFFHADMHQGNLFVDAAGDLVAVDFGIMGRLTPKDRRFLAEILYGFITRDYARVADVHFDAGYVPSEQSPRMFAQALARDRRAPDGQGGGRHFHGPAARPAVPRYRAVRHGDPAATDPSAENHGGGRRRGPNAQPQAQHVGHGGTGCRGMDAVQARTGGAVCRMQAKAPPRSGGSWPNCPNSLPAQARPPICWATWPMAAASASTGTRPSSWPARRQARTARSGLRSGPWPQLLRSWR